MAFDDYHNLAYWGDPDPNADYAASCRQEDLLRAFDRDGAIVFTHQSSGKGVMELEKPMRDVYDPAMAATFPDLGPNAAVDMHWSVPPLPRLSAPVPRRETFDRHDYHYRQDKRFTRGRGR